MTRGRDVELVDRSDGLTGVAADLPALAEDMSNLPDGVDGQWFRWPYGTGAAVVRRLDDARYVAVLPFIYTDAVVWGFIADAGWTYEDRWCYSSPRRGSGGRIGVGWNR